ncbi:MAG: sterol desaturase family protein [Pseudomonadota bacterium]
MEFLVSVWPWIWLNDALRYFLAAGGLTLVLWLGRAWFRCLRIQTDIASRRDQIREIAFSLLTITIFSGVGFSLFLGGDLFKLYHTAPRPTDVLIELTVMVLAHDTYFYWLHRGMHHPWWFRRIHRVHHRSRTPTPWAAYAFQPAEAVLEAGILPLMALCLPLSAVTVFLFTSHMILRNVLGHAGHELFPRWWLKVPVLRYINTTTHHDLHHATGRSNYGIYFTFWDRLCGTEHAEYAQRFDAVHARARIMRKAAGAAGDDRRST